MENHQVDLFDGAIGLGLYAYVKESVVPVVESFETYFDKPQFTMVFKNDTQKTQFISFGVYDTVNCASNISYANIISKFSEWSVNVSGYKMGKNVIKEDQELRPIYNFNFHSLPKQAFDSLVRLTYARHDHQSGEYVVDCKFVNSFPTISFNIEGTTFSLAGKDYVYKVCYFNV